MSEHHEVRVVVSGGRVTSRTEAAGVVLRRAERRAMRAASAFKRRSYRTSAADWAAGADDDVCAHGWAAMPAQARKSPRIDPASAYSLGV
jgi:hypothetical protein